MKIFVDCGNLICSWGHNFVYFFIPIKENMTLYNPNLLISEGFLFMGGRYPQIA